MTVEEEVDFGSNCPAVLGVRKGDLLKYINKSEVNPGSSLQPMIHVWSESGIRPGRKGYYGSIASPRSVTHV